jgi:hypothetical protein
LNVDMTASFHILPNVLFTIHQSFGALGHILNEISFSERIHNEVTSYNIHLQEDKLALLKL